MTESISDVFSNFAKKLSRFNQSGQDLPKRKTEDDILQDKINAGEAGRKQAVSKTYKIYKDPFGVLGKTSDRARAIYDDEQNLLKAYKLFKAVKEACVEKSDKETFISSFELESPLAKKSSYTMSGNFIYLICWLMFEEGISDFVPVLEEISNSHKLKFLLSENYHFDSNDSDLIRIVREVFY